jgi:hypothetical protein
MAKLTDWVNVISSTGAVTVGITAIVFSFFQFEKSLEAEKMREERKEIHTKLDEFYGPLLQLRMESKKLYQKFSSKFRAKDPNFATLTYLLNGYKFIGNDTILLREILKIGEECEKLIHNKAGLIDDSYLRTNIIPQAATHFLILRLAYSGVLKGDAEMYKDLVFPDEIDRLLEKRKKELEERLMALNKTQ